MLKKIFFTILSMIFSYALLAQTTETGGQSGNTETLIYVIVGLVLLISVLVLLVSIYTLYVVRTILRDERSKSEEGESETDMESESLWMKISKNLTKAKPIEEEEDILLDHNYDGIKELDNHLPPWWKWLFYFTIIWSIGYLLIYHVFNWLPLSAEAYENSIVKAEAAIEASKASAPSVAIDENNVTITTDESDLAMGETIFKRQCAVCHAQDGGGGVGPNMTDNYWIHGGRITNLFTTIKYGVPEKGMISWQSQLNPTEMRNVASYILVKLVGSQPANPKAPQGELYSPDEDQDQIEEQDTTQTASEEVAMR
jgi:cytochrome c oxidase cbb3-type subunit 3